MATPLLIHVLVVLLFSTSLGSAVKFFHISDLHLDTLYSQGGSIAARCHENASLPSDGLGPAGDYACDPPEVLIESALIKMKEVNPDPAFIVWTGDSNPHWVQDPGFDYIFKNLKDLTRLLHKYFGDSLIVPALGNHDTYPADQYMDGMLNNSAKELYTKYLVEGAWGDLIKDDNAKDTFKKCGFYSLRHDLPDSKSTVKFIVLNTNIYYYNKMELDVDDPCGQLSWLDSELANSKPDDQVFIMAHVPPGHFERDPMHPLFSVPNGQRYVQRYQDIVTKRSNAAKIVAHLYGHTHTDTFRLFMSGSEAVGMGLIPGSITPGLYLDKAAYGVNPGFRMFHYDDTKRLIENYEHFYLPLNLVPALGRDQSDDTEETTTIAPENKSDRSSRNSKFLQVDDDDDDDDRSKRQVLEPDTEENTTYPDSNQNDGELLTTTPQAEPAATEAESNELPPEVTTVKSAEDAANVTTVAPAADVDDTTDVVEIDRTLSPLDAILESGDNDTVTNNTGSSSSVNVAKSIEQQIADLWTFGYNATTAFNVTDLSLKNMHRVYVEMHDGGPNGEVFRRYFKHNTMYHVKEENQTCTGFCFDANMCVIENFVYKDLRACMVAKGHIDFPVDPFPERKEETAAVNGSSDDDDVDDEEPVTSEPPIVATPKPSFPTPETTTTTTTTTTTATVTMPHPTSSELPPLVVGDNGKSSSSSSSGSAGTGILLGFMIVLVLATAVGGLFMYKRIQRNRYRAQEFLLTDSVFRYDGYSQVDEA